MKNWYDSPLECGAQIDEQIAATYDVHAGERRILKNILPGKDAEVADGFADLVALLHFVEKTAQPGRRDVGHNTFLVDSNSGLLDGRLTQVCAEDLERDILPYLRQVFHQGDGMGVSFFSRGATGDPDAQRVV